MKNYQKPQTEAFEIQMQVQILQASNKKYNGWNAQVPDLNANDEMA